jgi:hypothetical protein
MRESMVVFLLSVLVIFLFYACLHMNPIDSSSAVVLDVELLYQHKDSSIQCSLAPPLTPYPFSHPYNHVAGDNLIYNDTDDCPHCSTYCVPASVAMIAKAYGMTGNNILQDHIYDECKSSGGEIKGNAQIETHGLGMHDGSGGNPAEAQDALTWALGGMTHEEYDGVNLDWTQLRDIIVQGNRLVLRIDHGGWPSSMSEAFPQGDNRYYQGHATVIAGYDDKNTENHADDLCLIYDPWPYYNDKSSLPPNALKGPGDTCDPYWLPLGNVLSDDANDRFLIPLDPLPE